MVVPLVAAAALLALPFLRLPAFYESFLYLVFHWIVLATSWNILSGYSGYFSFGHGAFFGLGIYTTAVLTARFQWPFLATLPVAAATAAIVAVVLGSIVFRVKRVRGELFALLTLAVTFVLATIILNTPIDGGPGVSLGGIADARHRSDTLVILLFSRTRDRDRDSWASPTRSGDPNLALGCSPSATTRTSRRCSACRRSAASSSRSRLSSALAGIAGGIHALFISYVTAAETFSIIVPLTVVLMSVLGGTRHWAGPAVGATLITVISYASTAGDYPLAGKAAVGAILIVVILFMPEGVLGTLLDRRAPSRVRARRDQERVAVAPRVSTGAPSRPAIGAALLTVRGVSRAFSGIQALAAGRSVGSHR